MHFVTLLVLDESYSRQSHIICGEAGALVFQRIAVDISRLHYKSAKGVNRG
jgi:hypothetical protein